MNALRRSRHRLPDIDVAAFLRLLDVAEADDDPAVVASAAVTRSSVERIARQPDSG
jgi:hypothetical protein